MKIEDFKDVEEKIQIYTERLDMKQLRLYPRNVSWRSKISENGKKVQITSHSMKFRNCYV